MGHSGDRPTGSIDLPRRERRAFHETPTQAERNETGQYSSEALLEMLLRENVYAEVRIRYRPTRRHANLKEYTVEMLWDGDDRPTYSITARSMRACLEQLVRTYCSNWGKSDGHR